MIRRTRLVGGVLAGVLTVGCSPTTYVDTSTTTSVAVTTTTLPTGTLEELLPVMLAEVQDLPRRVAEADAPGAAATRIEQLWAAARPAVETDWTDLVESFEFVVRRCRAAADRKRPADADRAFKNLTTIVNTILG